MITFQSPRENAMEVAAELLAGELRLLDTETTGVGSSAQIIRAAIVNQSGEVLFDSYVKPTIPIPPESTAIHGITDADVASAPTFAQLLPQLSALLHNQRVIIYNKAFDLRMLHQSAAARSVPFTIQMDVLCAMQLFGRYHGATKFTHRSLPGGDHTALGDCQATLQLLRNIADGSQE